MTFFPSQRNGLDSLLRRPRPTFWQKLWRQPCLILAHTLYTWMANRAPPASPSTTRPVSVVCISDTHNSQPDLPGGDILIHAGDLSQSGTSEELQAALEWLSSQPHPIKVVVAGNHDLLLDKTQDDIGRRGRANTAKTPAAESAESLRASLPWGDDIIYLQDEARTITCPNGRTLTVYASPYSPRHGNWAFQYPRAEDVWHGAVPAGTDILVTHAPPRGHCDLLTLGCAHLLREVWRVRPRLHVFGHVHEGYGREDVRFGAVQGAFERTAVAGGGVWNLAGTIYQVLVAFWGGEGGGRGSRSDEAEATGTGSWCTMVNASMVGGLRDEVRRRPITVVI